MGAIPGAKLKPQRATQGISLPPIRGAMWSGRLFDGPARLRRGSSAWRAGWTDSPAARTVAIMYLSEPLLDRHDLAVRAGGYVAVGQHAGKHMRRRLELAAQDVG